MWIQASLSFFFLLLTIAAGQQILTADQFCSIIGKGVYPHHELCHRYFNCSNPEPVPDLYLPVRVNECPYPELFDVESKQCTPYQQAKCHSFQTVATWACEYRPFQCIFSHCYPCELRYPSCVGKPDGLNEHPQRPGSGYYFECESGRNIGETTRCLDPTPTFDTVNRICVA